MLGSEWKSNIIGVEGSFEITNVYYIYDLQIPEVAVPVPGLEEIKVGGDVENVLKNEERVESDIIDIPLDTEGAGALLVRASVLYKI